MSLVRKQEFSLPTLDNTFSVVKNKVKIPTTKKVDGIEKVIDTEEYLGIEVVQSDIISFLGDINAKKIGVNAQNNKPILIYGIGLAGISSTRFHLCDIGIAEQRVLVSFKRKKLATKYPAAAIEAIMPELVYEACSSWQEAIMYGKFPLHFGVLSRVLMSQEYQSVIRKTRFTYDSLNVLEPCSSHEFWYQAYATHFSLANTLRGKNFETQAEQVIQQLQITVNTYQESIIDTFGEPDLTKVFENMSALFLEREKVENENKLPDELQPQLNSVGDKQYTPELNINRILELKNNPTELDKIKTPKQFDDLIIEISGQQYHEFKQLHEFLPDSMEDVREATTTQRKQALRQYLEAYQVEATENTEQTEATE